MRKGFTLLELVIVVIIIGILVAMALPQFARMAERGRAAKAQAGLEMIRKAEGINRALYSSYTVDMTAAGLGREVPEVINLDLNDTDWAYLITVPTINTFTVTASRSTGAYTNSTIIIDQDGAVSGTHPVITGTW